MASSDTENGLVECSVGSIVWVRRRNGSWWPGKILGVEELSASHVVSPRSGTPVKLLGREDASVDWYNLEKSKRVKPFRCGEFDDSIERAEASLGIPPKKREKYARREDAILHALELEKQLLETKYGKLGSSSNGNTVNLPDDTGKDSAIFLECLKYAKGKHVNTRSNQPCKGLDSSGVDKKKGLLLQGKESHQLRGDDDNSNLKPRMRVLQDIGLKSSLSQLKPPLFVASNGFHKPVIDDGFQVPLEDSLTTENGFLVNDTKLVNKRKRSDEVHVDESLAKRRDKRHPLVKILESSARVPVAQSLQLQPNGEDTCPDVPGKEKRDVYHAKRSQFGCMTLGSCDSFVDYEIIPKKAEIPTSKFEETSHPHLTGHNEEHSSGSTEDTETDSSQTCSLESDTDDGMLGLSDGDEHIELLPKSLGIPGIHGGHGSTSSDELEDLGFPGEASTHFLDEPILTTVGASKWQLKRKRNNRNLTRKFPNTSDRKFTKGYGYVEEDSFEKNSGTRMGKNESRYLGSISNMNWDDISWNEYPSWRGGWEETGEYYYNSVFDGRHIGDRMKSDLVDVDLKVQSSYQRRQHVPMISLMSKLNGKAIVGHPIPVETLENDSSEYLLVAADDFLSEDLDYEMTPQPIWSTARRTANSRVPHPTRLSSNLDCDEPAADLQYVDRKSSFGSSSKKASIIERKGPSMERKLVIKPPKKMSSFSTQKIKTLSSISTQRNHSNTVDGLLIKPELLSTTAVACIPAKLVFSRLYEALVCHN